MKDSSLGLGWALRLLAPSILTICWWLNLTMLTMFTLLTPGCISMAKTRCCWSLTSSLKSCDLSFPTILSSSGQFRFPFISNVFKKSTAKRLHWLELSLFLSLSSFAKFLSSSRINLDYPDYNQCIRHQQLFCSIQWLPQRVLLRF